jgi:hypothetical protein
VPKVKIDSKKISDWNSFHQVFKEAIGFPDFYGMNSNAWIDCMSDLRGTDQREVMSNKVLLGDEECLNLEIMDSVNFKERLPDIFAGLVDLTSAVNQRSSRKGKEPSIAIMFI